MTDFVDGRQLRHTDTTDHTRGADRAWSNADLDRIRTGFDEILCRLTRGDVAGNDLDVVPGLDRLHGLDHIVGVTMCGIDDHQIHFGFDQCRNAFKLMNAHCRTNPKSAAKRHDRRWDDVEGSRCPAL